jgi:phosphinothricin acetyltransferase
MILTTPDVRQIVPIEPMQQAYWPEVRGIYLEGIATGNARFEIAAPDWERWDAVAHPAYVPADCTLPGIHCWMVTLSRLSSRQVYSSVAEGSVYVAEPARGRGI